MSESYHYPRPSNERPVVNCSFEDATIFSWGWTRDTASREFAYHTQGMRPAGVVAHPRGGYVAFGQRKEETPQ